MSSLKRRCRTRCAAASPRRKISPSENRVGNRRRRQTFAPSPLPPTLPANPQPAVSPPPPRHERVLRLQPEDNARLAGLCGQFDEHIGYIEKQLRVEVRRRGFRFALVGAGDDVERAERTINALYGAAEDKELGLQDIHLALREQQAQTRDNDNTESEPVVVNTRYGKIRGRGETQNNYMRRIRSNDVNFGIGPAGTGKTWLAVACAVDALEHDEARRVILARPAVEAGERLGFLPGDLSQKVDPYLRPLYDALYEMLGAEKTTRLQERGVIEIAPLAYMRGRTLNDSFIILDEAQNTTAEQMKMFLTRIGLGSTAVITGDITQIDLPSSRRSGLRQAIEVLRDVDGISFTFFKSRDVVRHPLVQRIVDAYEQNGEDLPASNGD